MVDIAIVSVISATAVGLAGALTGPLTARGNRRHERLIRSEDERKARLAELRDRRRAAYVEALTIAIGFRWTVVNEGRIEDLPWPDARIDYLYRTGAEVLAWGSSAVRELWIEFVGDAASELTDRVADDVRDRIVHLVARLREQIHAELCTVEDDLRIGASSRETGASH